MHQRVLAVAVMFLVSVVLKPSLQVFGDDHILDPVEGGLGVNLHGRRIQSGTNTQPDGGVFSLNCNRCRVTDNSADNRQPRPRFIREFACHKGAEIVLQ